MTAAPSTGRTGGRPLFTTEDLRWAAAYACARAVHRLDHPSGTGEALSARIIRSTRRGQAHTWGSLDPDVFEQPGRAVYRLVLAAGTHMYTAVRAAERACRTPRPPLRGLDGAVMGTVRVGDVRHAAISLCHALLEEELTAGLAILDDPIASRFQLDGPSTTWRQLPTRWQYTATVRITELADRMPNSVWTAVDAALATHGLPVPRIEREAQKRAPNREARRRSSPQALSPAPGRTAAPPTRAAAALPYTAPGRPA
jgi:hypothetical protein